MSWRAVLDFLFRRKPRKLSLDEACRMMKRPSRFKDFQLGFEASKPLLDALQKESAKHPAVPGKTMSIPLDYRKSDE